LLDGRITEEQKVAY